MTELKQRFAFVMLLLAATVMAALPLSVAIRLGEFGGTLFGRVARDKRTMAKRHAKRLGVADVDMAEHLERTFRAYGRYWAEALWIRPSKRETIEAGLTHEGVEHVVRPRDAGTGMIFVLPHLGNWEFAGPLAASLGIQVVAVAENLANRRMREWFVDLRRQLGIDVVLATGSRQVMRDLEAAISDNAAVALLSDRDLHSRGVGVEFFGESTTLPAGPATLALRTGAPILPVAAFFSEDGGHHIVIGSEIVVNHSPPDRTAEIRRVSGCIAEELERLIVRAPHQWHLLQPNWPSDRAPAT